MIIDAPNPPVPEGMDETAWVSAISAIRGFCRWHIAPNLPEVLTLDGSGGGLLLLPTLHLTGLTAVTNNGTAATADELAAIQWSEAGAIKITAGSFSSKFRGVVVEVVHGYDFFPPEILAVARSLASAGPNGTPGRKLTSGPHSIELGEHAASGPFALSELHEAILHRYRIRPPS